MLTRSTFTLKPKQTHVGNKNELAKVTIHCNLLISISISPNINTGRQIQDESLTAFKYIPFIRENNVKMLNTVPTASPNVMNYISILVSKILRTFKGSWLFLQ